LTGKKLLVQFCVIDKIEKMLVDHTVAYLECVKGQWFWEVPQWGLRMKSPRRWSLFVNECL